MSVIRLCSQWFLQWSKGLATYGSGIELSMECATRGRTTRCVGARAYSLHQNISFKCLQVVQATGHRDDTSALFGSTNRTGTMLNPSTDNRRLCICNFSMASASISSSREVRDRKQFEGENSFFVETFLGKKTDDHRPSPKLILSPTRGSWSTNDHYASVIMRHTLF